MKTHNYRINVEWTGNKGNGTIDYTSYSRSHAISAPGREVKILCSSDSQFKGDKTKYNPEDLFVASIASCHMLWYLHLCAINDIVVTDYRDNASGILEEHADGSGQFTLVTLRPEVFITEKMLLDKATKLHQDAHKMCFIANSCNFEIEYKPIIRT